MGTLTAAPSARGDSVRCGFWRKNARTERFSRARRNEEPPRTFRELRGRLFPG
jgi:hypothetical protein